MSIGDGPHDYYTTLPGGELVKQIKPREMSSNVDVATNLGATLPIRGLDEYSPVDAAHLKSSKGWINTMQGRKVYPLDPGPETFNIVEEAHTLARVPRYNGQPLHAWPVAAHALAMSYIIGPRARRMCRALNYSDEITLFTIQNHKRWSLVHDNAEPYIGDFVYPLKQLAEFAFVNALERRYETEIAKAYGLSGTEMPTLVRQLDREICAYEAPIVYAGRLHPDWVFPEMRADEVERHYIEGLITSYLQCSTGQLERLYLMRFTELFPEHEFSKLVGR